MSTSKHSETTPNDRSLDRPSLSVPSVDHPWDDVVDHARRKVVRSGDRATHRAHHSLYEDMLN